MKNWSISAGRLLGAELRIHVFSLALLLPIWMTQPLSHTTHDALRGVVLMLLMLGSALLHELGHALVAFAAAALRCAPSFCCPSAGLPLWRRPRSEQQFQPGTRNPHLGGRAAGEPGHRRRLHGAFILAFLPDRRNCGRIPLCTPATCREPLLGQPVSRPALNLLPAYPLDGGRILRAYWPTRIRPATRRAVTIGQASPCMFFSGMYFLCSC